MDLRPYLDPHLLRDLAEIIQGYIAVQGKIVAEFNTPAPVTSLLLLQDGRIGAGLRSGDVWLVDPRTRHVTVLERNYPRTITERTVVGLGQLSTGELIVASKSLFIDRWDLRAVTMQGSTEMHWAPLSLVILPDDQILISDNFSVRRWNLLTNKIEVAIRIWPVNHMTLAGDRLILMSDLGSFSYYNFLLEKLKYVDSRHGAVGLAGFSDTRGVMLNHDGIRMYDPISDRISVISLLEGRGGSVTTIGDDVVVAGLYGHLSVFYLGSGQSERFSVDMWSVNALITTPFSDFIVVSGSDDRKIRCWI